jgi:hypothetical protein
VPCSGSAPACPLLADTVAKSLFRGSERKFSEPLMRFTRGDAREPSLHPYRSRTSVVALKSNAAAEKSKDNTAPLISFNPASIGHFALTSALATSLSSIPKLEFARSIGYQKWGQQTERALERIGRRFAQAMDIGLATFRLAGLKASIVPRAPHRKERKLSNPQFAEANRLASCRISPNDNGLVVRCSETGAACPIFAMAS